MSRASSSPLRDMLLTHGDHYMHLADLKSYLEADAQLSALYADPEEWARKAILNVAGSGKFSSDRTIAEYAARNLECKAMSNTRESVKRGRGYKESRRLQRNSQTQLFLSFFS